MLVKGDKPRLVLFAAVFAVVLVVAVVNALALWGQDVSRLVYGLMQLTAGSGAILCALIMAWRTSGLSRWWRLTAVASIAGWMLGQYFWMWSDAGRKTGVLPTPGVVAYFVALLCGLVTTLLLVRAGGGLRGRPDRAIRNSPVTTVLDALVAALSFSILVALAGSGAVRGTAPDRMGTPTASFAYWLLEVLVVIVAVAVAMTYLPSRPYRLNYLLLATGGVLAATADRLVVYLGNTVGEGGELWGGIGFVLAPVLVGYGLLDFRHSGTAIRRSDNALELVQLALPYAGFLGVAVLFAFHVLSDQRLDPIAVGATGLMVLLVAVRQVVAMRAQRRLTYRLYDTQRRLAHQVHHDSLTGLPNRLLFAQRLDEVMRGNRFVLIFVDLDDFKDVNDRFGHAAGDELLRAVGERLLRCVAEPDTVARIGGDEFAILVDGEQEEPEVVADRLRVALREPFAVHGSSVRIRASMGVVRPAVDEPSPSPDDLMRQADLSMYAGKRLGKDTAVVYQPTSDLTADFPTVLRKADGGVPAGFQLVYQPVVRVPDGAPQGVEALARWNAPNGIELPPETFVAAAEAAGLGATLDAMVLDLACEEVKRAGIDLVLYVNIGGARLGNAGFEQQVLRTLTRHGIPPTQLVLEITETVPIVDLAGAAAQIERLNEFGVKVALDDFGTGYNSLMYLHALPVQIVKLDRSLAVGAERHRDVTLYRSVIGLCDALDLDVIAEGIETSAQAQTIAAAGCGLAQGHLYGTPAPIAELAISAVGVPVGQAERIG
ncbi:putative bifunctional diguanylate cyclase/phosphodiesterase [Mycobacterium deserti]|uniref:EAL domain-containing protein n=1 Tax=Mycobacterium deserti TaxID=2978347 RepID=A0ABT2MFN6_9MYCO|nr:EAL domain-containing protein [Mycobacterium deserti]MCT7661077.1 EAL domain-containing protein [Mycobacterium deserti]